MKLTDGGRNGFLRNNLEDPILESAVIENKSPSPGRNTPFIPNGVLAMIFFVAMEIMFFAALISAYTIVKSGALFWPPPDQPRLPVTATAVNSLVLFTSGWLLFRANQSFSRKDKKRETIRLLRLAIILGICFVLFQGFEWVRLIGYGLTMTSSTYASFFYLIIGTHGAHALAALLVLYLMLRKLRINRLSREEFWASQIFWYFVVGVWPVLYILVYLN